MCCSWMGSSSVGRRLPHGGEDRHLGRRAVRSRTQRTQRKSRKDTKKCKKPDWTSQSLRPCCFSFAFFASRFWPLLPQSPGFRSKPGAPVATQGRSYGVQHYCAVQPPSMAMLLPVICAAASEHRNTASAATCSTVTNSLVGCAASMTSRLTCSSVRPRAFMVSGI
jgi:hypothetical protein